MTSALSKSLHSTGVHVTAAAGVLWPLQGRGLEYTYVHTHLTPDPTPSCPPLTFTPPHTYANTLPVCPHSCTVQHLTGVATRGVVNNAFTTTASVNGQCGTVQGGRCPVSRGWLGTAQHTSLALTFLKDLEEKNHSKVAYSCFSFSTEVPIAYCTLLALIYFHYSRVHTLHAIKITGGTPPFQCTVIV